VGALLGASSIAVLAQDTRVVTEPVISATCVRLEARIIAVGEKIAEADEARGDSTRIQNAIDHCGPGRAVELAPETTNVKKAAGQPLGNAFLSGPLELREGVTLLIDKGVTLFASRHAADYDTVVGSGVCGTLGVKGRCRPFITIRAKHTAIMGDGVIDGRGGAKLLDKGYSWWALAVKAEPGNIPYSDPRLIDAAQADGFTLYRITLHNSPNFHVGVAQTDGFTVWGVHLKTPTVEPGPNDPRPRNTDGIDPGTSTNITIAHSWIDNGDDNIAIKSGVTHMSVIDNHFYSGHGMSIGSETYGGVSQLLVDGLTEERTTSGIRIKSNATRGGLVHDLVYRNVCMRDVKMPISISPYYNEGTTEPLADPGIKGDRIPDYKSITLDNVFDETPGEVLIAGFDDQHRTEIDWDGVHIEGILPAEMHVVFADLHQKSCSAYHNGPLMNLPLTGLPASVKIIPSSETGCAADTTHPVDPCEGKFVPMQ
jgi:polygalacturonase